jgi:hypothetical protein
MAIVSPPGCSSGAWNLARDLRSHPSLTDRIYLPMPTRRAHRRIEVAGAIAVLAILATTAACRRDSHDSIDLPLSCPAGATLMGAPPSRGQEVWCQKIVGGKPVKDGVFVAYGTGADRMIQGYYRDGVQEGEWTTWYENGERSAVDHYRNGVQDGPHTSWYANGVKALEGDYRGGKREGRWTRWDPGGLSSRQEIYRDDRKVENSGKGS